MKYLVLLAFVSMQSCVCAVVDPGNRGVQVNLGEVRSQILPEGFTTKSPLTNVREVSVRQETKEVQASCFSSDLQQVQIHVKIMFRVPEANVIKVFKDYSGNPFDSLIAPRIQEALKEVSAGYTAEQLVKQREELKTKTLVLAKTKVGDLLFLEDLVIENLDLSDQLEHAIEAKMVQEQEAAKARFVQQKAEIEANTTAIRAEGEARSIRIRGQALKDNPAVIDLQIVEKWDGKSPLVVGGGQGANVLLPMTDLKK